MDTNKKSTVKMSTIQTLTVTCIDCKGEQLKEGVAYFYKIRNTKDHSLINKTQSQISNPLSVLNCGSYCNRSFINKNCDKSFINKPAFLNSVPQLIR